MGVNYILMWLESPLQSWGHDSRFSRRDTLNFPTKSGVLGLVACAMGKRGPQTDWLERVADAPMTVVAFPRNLQPHEPVPGLLEDFQMIGSGYDDKDGWESLLIPKTSEGKKAVGGGTKLTYRYYLQDMAFGVVLGFNDKEAQEVAAALQNPVWDLYLGRKCCAPSDVIYRGSFDVESDALEQAFAIAKEKDREETFRVVSSDADADETFSLNDVPVQFGAEKKYRDRMVSIIKAS